MNRPCKELKRIARGNLNNRYTIPMGAAIIASIITAMIELPFSMLQATNITTAHAITFYIAEFIILLISMVISVGQLKLHLSMARKQKYTFSQLFYAFKNQPDRYLVAALLQIFLLILTLIPMTAGIVAAFLYTKAATILLAIALSIISVILTISVQLKIALVYFVLLEQENINVLGAIETSRRLMKGNSKRLLYIVLSFIGLQFLCFVSFGIASFWVTPYQTQTLVLFYLDVIGELPQDFSEQYRAAKENLSSFSQYV